MRKILVNKVIVLLLLAILSISTVSSIFVYLPVYTKVSPAQPVLRIWEPLHGSLTYTLGANMTSIRVEVDLSTIGQLLSNPDFYTSMDAWTCAGNQSLVCNWLPSDTGASGGVLQITGTIATRTSMVINKGALQIFMVPTQISQLTLVMRFNFSQGPLDLIAYNFVYGALYWWNGTGWQRLNLTLTRIYQASTYQTVTLQMTPSQQLQPGQVYLIYTGYGTYPYFSVRTTLDFKIDYIYLNVSSTQYIYGGQVFRLNTTKNVSTEIYITGFQSNSTTLNADLWLFNGTHIMRIAAIRSGSLVYTGTPFFIVHPSGDSMNASAWIWLEANSTTTTANVTLTGVIHYTNGVYHVFYPFYIKING